MLDGCLSLDRKGLRINRTIRTFRFARLRRASCFRKVFNRCLTRRRFSTVGRPVYARVRSHNTRVCAQPACARLGCFLSAVIIAHLAIKALGATASWTQLYRTLTQASNRLCGGAKQPVCALSNRSHPERSERVRRRGSLSQQAAPKGLGCSFLRRNKVNARIGAKRYKERVPGAPLKRIDRPFLARIIITLRVDRDSFGSRTSYGPATCATLGSSDLLSLVWLPRLSFTPEGILLWRGGL